MGSGLSVETVLTNHEIFAFPNIELLQNSQPWATFTHFHSDLMVLDQEVISEIQSSRLRPFSYILWPFLEEVLEHLCDLPCEIFFFQIIILYHVTHQEQPLSWKHFAMAATAIKKVTITREITLDQFMIYHLIHYLNTYTVSGVEQNAFTRKNWSWSIDHLVKLGSITIFFLFTFQCQNTWQADWLQTSHIT